MTDESLPVDRGELPAITGLFGALTRLELQDAVSILCERRGRAVETAAIEEGIDRALSACRLLVAPMAVDPPLDDAPIVVGPRGSPALPAEAAWLLEQVDVEPRALEADAVRRAADTELSQAIERARTDEIAAPASELESVREGLSDWQPVTIDPTTAIAETTPVEADELAGIVEPFGALTRLELRQAASVLCYRRGTDAPESALETAIDRALSARQLLVAPSAVETPLGDAPIVVGPMASPTLPAAFDDLAGLLGIDPRPIDPAAVTQAAREDRSRLDETDSVTPDRTVLEDAIDRWEPAQLESPTITETTETAPTAGVGAADSQANHGTDDSESVPTTDSDDSTSALDASLDEEYLLATPATDDLPDLPIEADELAGAVDLFGALTRPELRQAISELCYRQGVDVAVDDLDAVIDDALSAFVLLAAPGVTAEPLGDVPIVAGPAAFPAHPEHAEDLPHILDIDPRDTERAVARDAAITQLQAAVDIVVEEDQTSEAARLLELCYDLETWGAVSLDPTRQRLQQLLD